MGQYFMAVTYDEHNYKVFDPSNYKTYCKLTEHSFVANNFLAVIYNQLLDSQKRLWWVGDYAEMSDYPNISLPEWVHCTLKNSKTYKKGNTDWDWGTKSYFINHSKKEFIEISPYDYQKDEYILNPVSLLTAVGNGKGGGDYYGINKEFIGIWAGDVLEIKRTLPDAVNAEYVDTGLKYIFKEEY